MTYGINPVGLAIEGSGSTVLATDNSLFSSLYRPDVASGAPVQITGAGVGSPDFALLPNGQEVLVTSSGILGSLGNLLRINLSTLQGAIVTQGNGFAGVVPESTGMTALLNISTSGTVDRVALDTGDMTVLAQGLNQPWGIVLEDSGESALVGSLSGVSRVDLSTGAVSTLTTTGARYLAIKPGRGSAILSVENTGLSRLDLSTGSVVDLVTGIPVVGKVVVEAADNTALVATLDGIKRVRIR